MVLPIEGPVPESATQMPNNDVEFRALLARITFKPEMFPTMQRHQVMPV
jgi:hypothetical protein